MIRILAISLVLAAAALPVSADELCVCDEASLTVDNWAIDASADAAALPGFGLDLAVGPPTNSAASYPCNFDLQIGWQATALISTTAKLTLKFGTLVSPTAVSLFAPWGLEGQLGIISGASYVAGRDKGDCNNCGEESFNITLAVPHSPATMIDSVVLEVHKSCSLMFPIIDAVSLEGYANCSCRTVTSTTTSTSSLTTSGTTSSNSVTTSGAATTADATTTGAATTSASTTGATTTGASTTGASTTGATSTTGASTTGASTTSATMNNATTTASSTGSVTSTSTSSVSSTSTGSVDPTSTTTGSSTTATSSTGSSSEMSTTAAAATTTVATSASSGTTSGDSSTTGDAPTASSSSSTSTTSAVPPSPSRAASSCTIDSSECKQSCIFVAPSKAPQAATTLPEPSKSPEIRYYTIEVEFPCEGPIDPDCCDIYGVLPDATESNWKLCDSDSTDSRRPSFDAKSGLCKLFMYAEEGASGITDDEFETAVSFVESAYCDSTEAKCWVSGRAGQTSKHVYSAASSVVTTASILLALAAAAATSLI